MSDWLLFGIAALATYRFAHAFALETGQGGIFNAAREWVINRYGYSAWQSEFLHCPLCQGFWLALLVAGLLYAGRVPWNEFLAIWWGLAGAVTLIHLLLYPARG